MQIGSPVTKFTIAVNRRTKHDDSADSIDVVAWDKFAEKSNTYLRKERWFWSRAACQCVVMSQRPARSIRPLRSLYRSCKC